MISGNSETSLWRKLGSDTKIMSNGFGTAGAYSTSTNSNYYYKLIVSGTYGTSSSSVAYMDPAYISSNISNQIGTDTPILNSCTESTWKFLNACPPIPNFPIGYSSNHTYEYYIGKWLTGPKYSFSEPNYRDNNGSLTFEVWQNQGKEEICEGSSATLVSNLTGDISWFKDDLLLPATGQTITVSQAGKYYAKSTVNGVISSASNPITVIINPLPTVSLGTPPIITSNNSSFTIPISSSTNKPTQFSISAIPIPALNYMNGFTPVLNDSIRKSGLIVRIPFGQTGKYNFQINVKNPITGCISQNYTSTVQINLAPPEAFTYNTPNIFVINQPINTLFPDYIGIIEEFKITSGTLPIGLYLDQYTGEIFGTPTQLTNSIISIEVTGKNSQGSATTNVEFIIVVPAPSNLVFNSNNYVFTQYTPISPIQPRVSGSEVRFRMAQGSTTLPRGITLDPITGEISGTPLIPSARTTYTISAYNSTGSVEIPIEITVQIAPPNFAYAIPNILYLGSIITPIRPVNAENGGIVSSYSITPNLPEGLNLNPVSGIITGTPTQATESKSYTIKGSNANGDFEQIVTFETKIPEISNLTYPTPITLYLDTPFKPIPPSSINGIVEKYTIGPELPGALAFDSITGEIKGIPSILSDTTIYTITATNNFYTLSFKIKLNVVIPPPSSLIYFSPTKLIQDSTLAPVSPTYSGLATEFKLDKPLPLGLNFNSATGVVTGKPSVFTGLIRYIITASNSTGSTSAPLDLEVLIAPPKNLKYNTPVIYEEEVKISPLNPSVIGKVDTYTIDKALPDGLSLDPLTGIISGTPTKAIPLTEYWVTASNTTGSARARLVITVLIARPRISYPEPVLGAQINPVYSGVDLFISGATNPPIIPVIKGVVGSIRINKPLPTGLKLDTLTGIISGIPSELADPTNYVVTITNSTASTTDTIRIATVIPRPSSLSYLTPQTYIEKIKIDSLNPRVQGIPSLYTVDKSLPAGLSLNPRTGSITGTPTKAQDFTDYTITASNSTGYDTFTVTIKVLIAFPEIKYPLPGVFRQGVPVSFKPALVGIADSFKIDSLLPAGLNFDPKTGLISGTPIWPAKPRTYVVTATNSTGPGVDSTTITVLEDVNYDTDKDGYTDIVEIGGDRNNPVDTDKDGLPDYNDLDSDGDEIKDEWENDLNYGGLPDCDHDGVDNRIDPDACDPVAFQGISPNGDGKNDYLVIPGVMRTTPNTLTVFNRGGDIVYEVKDYANNWGGETNRGNPLLAGDGLLPDGVYFYILDYNGVRPRVSTYIYINRLKK